MTASSSLWPEGIEYNRVRAPLVILREQGTLLGKITKNLVQGEVRGEARGTDYFQYYFYITSPVVGYEYQLLSISHDIGLYPVEITVEDSIFEDIADRLDVQVDEEYNWIKASTEKEFQETLRQIFGAKKTTRIITALLSQADPDWDAKADWTSPRENPAPEEDTLPF